MRIVKRESNTESKTQQKIPQFVEDTAGGQVRCGLCRKEKPRSEFWVNNSNPRGRGLTYRCRDCHRIESLKRRYRLTWEKTGRKELNRLLSETSERMTILQSVLDGAPEIPASLIEQNAGEKDNSPAITDEILIKCNTCRREKPRSAFYANHANPRGKGINYQCKECHRWYRLKKLYAALLQTNEGKDKLERLRAEMSERIELMRSMLSLSVGDQK